MSRSGSLVSQMLAAQLRTWVGAPSVVICAWNPSPGEAEIDGFLGLAGQGESQLYKAGLLEYEEWHPRLTSGLLVQADACRAAWVGAFPTTHTHTVSGLPHAHTGLRCDCNEVDWEDDSLSPETWRAVHCAHPFAFWFVPVATCPCTRKLNGWHRLGRDNRTYCLRPIQLLRNLFCLFGFLPYCMFFFIILKWFLKSCCQTRAPPTE